MSKNTEDFKYFGWDEEPLGKYKQPMKNPRFSKTAGYPQDEMDLTGTKSRGRFIKPYGAKKHMMDIRGYGAAERGRKFHTDDEEPYPINTKG